MIVVSITIIIAAIQTEYNTNWKVIHRNQLRQVTFLLPKSGHFPMCSIYSKLKNMKFGGYIRFRKTIWAFWICQNTHQNSDSSHWIEASFIYAAIAVVICCFNRQSGNQGCVVRSSITAIWDCMQKKTETKDEWKSRVWEIVVAITVSCPSAVLVWKKN